MYNSSVKCVFFSKLALLTGALLAFGAASTSFAAPVYTGNLTHPTGLFANASWASPSSTLSWTVSQNQDGSWHYDYDFSVPEKDISHIIFETSLTFTEADILNLNWPRDLTEVQTHTSANGNPDIPAGFYGVKFNSPSEGTTSWNIEFDSWRQPVWGDFYARDGRTGGQLNSAWNLGFTAADPADPPQNGSIDSHVLVPDTIRSPGSHTPEPATLGLVGLALLVLPVAMRRRRPSAR
jgi:MYXO-CTERM domain-containing protein